MHLNFFFADMFMMKKVLDVKSFFKTTDFPGGMMIIFSTARGPLFSKFIPSIVLEICKNSLNN